MSLPHARARRGLRALLLLPITALVLVIAPSGAVHAATPAAAHARRARHRRVGVPAGWPARSPPTAATSKRSAHRIRPTPRTPCSACTRPGSVGTRPRPDRLPQDAIDRRRAERGLGQPRSIGGTTSWPRRAEQLHPGSSEGTVRRTTSSAGCSLRNGPRARTPASSGRRLPTFDGAFRQGLALAALAAAGVPKTNARVPGRIAWLAHQQCANGLWEAYRSDTSMACLRPTRSLRRSRHEQHGVGGPGPGRLWSARRRAAHVRALVPRIQSCRRWLPVHRRSRPELGSRARPRWCSRAS